MKIVIYRHGDAPIEIEADRARIMIGPDHYELREQNGEQTGLLIRIEEHDGNLAQDLAVFPTGGNSVRLRGGLR